MFRMSPAGCNACAIHWSSCQKSLPGPDSPIPPRHAGAVLSRPWSCGACTHTLVGFQHRVVDAVKIRTMWRPQRGRNEKNIRRGRGCFWNTNILDFQISQGSVATQLRWGRSLYNNCIANFLRNLAVRRIVKVGVHLPKLWPNNKVAVFWNTV